MRTDILIWLISSIRYHATELLTKELAKAGADDLVPSQGAMLSSLYGRGGRASMKELVSASGKRKSSMTEMANALERRGYLKREPDPEDARGVVLVLTDKARALEPAFGRISTILLDAAWGAMPQSQRETLMALLESVLENLRRRE